MAKPQLRNTVAARLAAKKRDGFTWTDVVAAIQAAAGNDRNQLLAHVRANAAGLIGNDILALLGAYALAQGETEADAMLADDSVTADELEQLL